MRNWRSATQILLTLITSRTNADILPAVDDRPSVATTSHAGSINGHAASARAQPSGVVHPFAQHALPLLRDPHTPAHRARAASAQLLATLLWEAAKSLPTRPGATGEHLVIAKPLVLLAVTRAGIGLAHRMAELFSPLLVGAISYERETETTGEARLHLASAPPLSDARIVLFNPVVSTGSSSAKALRLLQRSGANDIALLTFAIESQVVQRLTKDFPALALWAAAAIPARETGGKTAAAWEDLTDRLQTHL
jgi:uracil phosphoribosyltransferase